MWADSLAMLEEVDKMRRQCFELTVARTGGPSWEPPVDIYETQRELTIIVALPGVPAATVNVVIDGGSLSVTGRRQIPAPSSATVHRMEIPYGRFERRIDLRAGMYEITRRDIADGCLFITLMKHS